MWQKAGQIVFFILVVSAAALLQFSFLPALPELPAAGNLVLVLVVFLLFFFGLRRAVAAALLAGIWLDILSFGFFGFNLLVLVLTVGSADWILRSWLTNRSLYAWVLLMVAATAAYSLSAGLLTYILVSDGRTFFLATGAFWSGLLYQSLDNAAAALILFALAAAATRRLSPFFLAKT